MRLFSYQMIKLKFHQPTPKIHQELYDLRISLGFLFQQKKDNGTGRNSGTSTNQ